MTDFAQLIPVFLIGATIGSFLNVCITRWPRQLSVVHPRSRCPVCERPIEWYENIPMISWLLLRGRCRGCKTPISSMYPIVELVTAVLWTVSVLSYGLSFTALRIAIFGTIALGVSVTDLREYSIPDGFTVGGFLWNFLAAFIALYTGDPGPFALPMDALYGACTGAGLIAIVGWLGEVALRKEAMGFGDVTVMAMCGVALGPRNALIAVFLAAVLATATYVLIVYPVMWLRSRASGGKAEEPLVPFAFFLAPASLLTLIWGERLYDWWRTELIVASVM